MIMKKLKKLNPILLLLLGILFFCSMCKKEEDYYDVTYYDAIGIGYVYIYDYRKNC